MKCLLCSEVNLNLQDKESFNHHMEAVHKVVLNEKLMFSLHFLTNEEKLWMIELTQQRCFEEHKSSKIDKTDFDVLPRKSIAHKIKLWEGKQAFETETAKIRDESYNNCTRSTSLGTSLDDSIYMDGNVLNLNYVEEVNSSDVERLAENIDLIKAIRKNKNGVKSNGDKILSPMRTSLEIAKDSMLFDFSRKVPIKKGELKAEVEKGDSTDNNKTCDSNDNHEHQQLTCDSFKNLNETNDSDICSINSDDNEFVTTKRKSLARFLPRKLTKSLENILDI